VLPPPCPIFAACTRAPPLPFPLYEQKLEGRCRRDGPTAAFCRLDHTEVPALREHVHDIARRWGGGAGCSAASAPEAQVWQSCFGTSVVLLGGRGVS
jgi:hypothetical protein